MQEMTREQLAPVAQLLLQDPATYRAYGPYWWSIKAALASAYPNQLWFAQGYDDTRIRKLMERWYPDPQDLLAAALNHYRQKVVNGERYEGHSYLPGPNEETYNLYDPDMGPANATH